jgi:GT2 family glycosyltransferase
MNIQTELSVIIVSYNVRDLLAGCLRSLYDACPNAAMEVIVVDNASSDGSAQMVRDQFSGVIMIENQTNNGFARANNQGYAVSQGAYILLLNPDTVVKPGAIKAVINFMAAEPKAGMAACRLLNQDGSLQRSVRRLPSVSEYLLKALFLDRFFYPENRSKLYYRSAPFTIGYPTGAFMLVRRTALNGGMLLDDRYFMYSEEKDLAHRLQRNGYGCWFVPGAEIVHYGRQSTDQSLIPMFLELQKSQVIFFKEHYPRHLAWALALSWWLVLFTGALSSVLTLIAGKRKRHILLSRALFHYPANLRLLWSE